MTSGLAILIGRGNPNLGAAIAKELNKEPIKREIIDRPDTDIHIDILESVRGKHVVIVQPTCRPVPRNHMELCLLCNALDRASVAEITCLIPYLGLARQDRITGDHNPVSAAWAVQSIKGSISSSTRCRIAVLDIHSLQTQGSIQGPFEIIPPFPVTIPDMIEQYGKSQDARHQDLAIACTDVGGSARARLVAKILTRALDRPIDAIIVDKERDEQNNPGVKAVIGDPSGKYCLIVDDIIDTAGSLVNAANSLIAKGATGASAYCTHAILSDPCLKIIGDSPLQEIVVTDSVPLRDDAREVQLRQGQGSRFRVLPLASYLSRVIGAIHKGEPTRHIRMVE